MEDWRLVADQDGIAEMRDLRHAGLTYADVVALSREEQLTLLSRGWYALGRPASPEAKHVLMTKAALRAHDGRAVAGHHSALLRAGLPTYRADLDTVRLSRTTPGSPRTRAGLRLGRLVPPEAHDGLSVVPELAVVQHGISAGPLSALVAADALLHRGDRDPTALLAALEWVRWHPRSATLRRSLTRADGRHESPGETVLAHLLGLMHVPVTPQHLIVDHGFTAVADFVVDGEMVVLEFDGRVKYSRSEDEIDPFGRKRAPQQVVWDEKVREDRIRDLGYEVVRVTWADLQDPRALERRVRAAIERAGRRRRGVSA